MRARIILTIAGLFFLMNTLAADTRINYTTTNLQLFPKVAHPDGGGYLFAWVSNEDPDFEIYARVFDSNLSNPSPSSDETCLSKPTPADGHRLHGEIIPSIKGTDKGAIVAWVDHKGKNVWTIRVTSSGIIDQTFNNGNKKLVHPANPTYVYTPPQMCQTIDGGAIFVWVEKTGSGPYIHSVKAKCINSSGNPGWEETLASASTSDPKAKLITLPRICSYTSGGAIIAWTIKEGGIWKIYIQRIDSNGNTQYSSPKLVAGATDAGFTYNNWWDSGLHRWAGLDITVSGSNTFIVMKRWITPRNEIEGHSHITPIRLEEIAIARMQASDGSRLSIEVLETIDYGYAGSSGQQEEGYKNPMNRECYSCLGTPEIAASSDGGAFLAWSEGTWNRSTGSRNNDAEIYVVKINSSGSGVWTQWISAAGCNYDFNGAPQIVGVDNNTNAAVIWQNYDRGLKPTTGEGRVYVSKITSSGSYTTPQAVGSNANAWSFDVVSTGSGVVITWSNKSGGDWDIHAESISF